MLCTYTLKGAKQWQNNEERTFDVELCHLNGVKTLAKTTLARTRLVKMLLARTRKSQNEVTKNEVSHSRSKREKKLTRTIQSKAGIRNQSSEERNIF